jgi:hypothetical protein
MFELAFRHKLLMIVPVVLGLVVGVAWFWSTQEDYYLSRASIRVDRPSFYPSDAFIDFSPYLSPAQNQAEAMNEWLGTAAFTNAVVDRANETTQACLAPAVTPQDIQFHTGIRPNINKVVYVEHAAKDPCVAQKVTIAIVDEYTDVFTAELKADATQAANFYQSQLDRALEEQNRANAEYTAYVATHPELRGEDITELSPNAAGDAGFVRVAAALQNANGNVRETQARLLATQDATTEVGVRKNFQVLDEPQPGALLQPGTRAMATKPVLGLGAGLFVSAAIFLALWRLDRTVRLPGDLAFIGKKTPVMMIPALKSKRRRWPRSFVRLATAMTNGMYNLG